MRVLAHEDFSDIPVGNISLYPYSPDGEYHIIPKPFAGNWEEATIQGSWRPGNGCWLITPEDGRHTLEQSFYCEHETPLMVSGSRFWDNYTLSADVRPLGWHRPIGLVFRYQNSRCYYLFALYRDHVSLIKREHPETRPTWGGPAALKETILASAPWTGTVDRYVRVEVNCFGNKVSGSIDGQLLVSTEDDAFSKGRIGCLAESQARFAEIKVTTDETSYTRIAAAEAAWEADEKAAQAKWPQPIAWKRLSTAGFGTDRNLRWGDLDGDGELEVIVPQALAHDRGDGHPMIVCVTALKQDGTILWRVGEPIDPSVGDPHHMTGDVCIQVHDWTGDGRAEVVYCRDFKLQVLDGRTGQVIQQVPTPEYTDYEDPYTRCFGDSIFFCDLQGAGRKANLLLKDRYDTVWAYDNDLNVLWMHHLKTGHYPMSCDVDGDGKDEVFIGYSLVDNDGTILWSLDNTISDHMDGVFIGRLAGPDSPVRIIMGCSDEGYVMLDAQGNILKRHFHGHCQGATIGRFQEGSDELQIAAVTFWHEPGIITFYDINGNTINQFEPLHIGSIMPPLDWGGTGTALVLHNTDPEIGGMFDINGHWAVRFPDDGHPTLCYDALDVDGDGRQEIVSWDFNSIWIYKADPTAVVGEPKAYDTTSLYNNSNYRGRWLI